MRRGGRGRRWAPRVPGRGVVSVAKAYVGRLPRSIDDCVQINGGIGVTWEHDIHLYARRVAVNRAVYGSPEEHKERLCRAPRDGRRCDASDRSRASTQFRRTRARGSTQNLARGAATRPFARGRAELQALIFDAGFAGIAFPTEYGGGGLTLEHQKAFFDDACKGRRTPSGYMVSIGMMGPTLLDHGSEELKRRHLPRILRGDEEWMQLLSEPSGGSDMAGAITRLTRDGDTYVLNGAKMWSTGARAGRLGHVPGPHRLGRARSTVASR